MEHGWQGKKAMLRGGPAKGWELVVPNPKLKLMDQLREVMRLQAVEGSAVEGNGGSS